jgi:hypothetical protein
MSFAIAVLVTGLAVAGLIVPVLVVVRVLLQEPE